MLWKGVKKQDSGYNSHVLLKEKHTRLAYVHKENLILTEDQFITHKKNCRGSHSLLQLFVVMIRDMKKNTI